MGESAVGVGWSREDHNRLGRRQVEWSKIKWGRLKQRGIEQSGVE